MVEAGSLYRTLTLAGALGGVSLVAVLLRTKAPSAFDRAWECFASTQFRLLGSIAALLVFGGLLVMNAAFPGYVDLAEANVASVSWLLLQGAPLYHSLDSAARYSLLYGPTTYLPFSAALALGGGIGSLKIAVILANTLMLAFLWKAYRTLLDPLGALVATVVVLLFILVPRPNGYLFQTRADVTIMCAVAVALFGASRRTGVSGLAAMIIGSGIVVDAKASGFIYILPLLAMLYDRRGWRQSLLVTAGIVAVAGLPFLLPNISPRQYLAWLQRATGHPRTVFDLMSTLRTLPILALPILLVVGPTPWREPRLLACLRDNRNVLVALTIGGAVAVAASSRIGAGSHHILPFLPVAGYEAILLYQASEGRFARESPWVFRYLFTCVAVIVLTRIGGGLNELSGCSWSRWEWAEEVDADVRATLDRYRGHEIGMGYGDSVDPLLTFRPAIVFATNHLLLDDIALSDMAMDRIPMPQATLDALGACATDVWLIPAGQEPFTMPSMFAEYYPRLVPRTPLFGADFREVFARRYAKVETTGYFDVWTCKRPRAVAEVRE